MNMNVCYKSTSVPTLGQRLQVDCDTFATYLVVYLNDLNVQRALVLCEVEVVLEEGKAVEVSRKLVELKRCGRRIAEVSSGSEEVKRLN